MRSILLSDITSDEVSAEARTLVEMLRTSNPRLDLRRGTVLRSLLVDTDAAVGAWYGRQAEEQRSCSSFLELSRRAESGEQVDASDLAAVLSNFNMEAIGGTAASGAVIVVVSSRLAHTVYGGFRFKTADGVYFSATSNVTASLSPTGSETTLHRGASGTNWWFLVPVSADEPGSAGNIGQGTALETDSVISDFVSASAYSDFSGGSDVEDVASMLSRVRSALSARGLTTESAVEARLRDEFDATDAPIRAVSVCGYGHPAQFRDRHNVFGVSVGGRVDIYVRNFKELPLVTLESVSGKAKGDGTYELGVSCSDVPGMLFTYSVSDAGSTVMSSYAHSTEWSAVPGSWGWHDVESGGAGCAEVAGTVWRDARIVVSGVVPTDEEEVSGEKLFKVVVAALPKASELQEFVDDGAVRNSGSDFIVRGPTVVNVSVTAAVRHGRDIAFDVDSAVAKICDYVNSTGFVGRITRSEIASILIGMGARSVDMPDGCSGSGMLSGYLHAADGTTMALSGDALDVSVASDPANLVHPDTCVFVAEPRNVRISAVVE